MNPPEPKPPVVPDHELLRLIGRGSYGEVWLGRNVMGSFRAIKVVYRASFDSDRPYEREFGGLQKFEPVSRTHSGLMSILHIGRNEAAGYFYCVMEVADDPLHGQTFTPETYQPRTLASEIRQRGRLPAGECVSLGIALASALGHLHARGLVHRDVKPSNIIFTNGVPKLADIGLVTQIGSRATFVGTEGYLPPEGPGSPGADLYSLARVLYEISFGKSQDQFPDLPTRLRDIPEAGQLMRLNRIILKACDPQPAKRFQSAEDFRSALVALGEETQAMGGKVSTGISPGAAPGSRVVVLHPAGTLSLAKGLVARLRAAGFQVFVDDLSELTVDWARQMELEVSNAHGVVAFLSGACLESEPMAYALDFARQSSSRPKHLPRILTMEAELPEVLPLQIAAALEGAIRIVAREGAAAAIEEAVAALTAMPKASS